MLIKNISFSNEFKYIIQNDIKYKIYHTINPVFIEFNIKNIELLNNKVCKVEISKETFKIFKSITKHILDTNNLLKENLKIPYEEIKNNYYLRITLDEESVFLNKNKKINLKQLIESYKFIEIKDAFLRLELTSLQFIKEIFTFCIVLKTLNIKNDIYFEYYNSD